MSIVAKPIIKNKYWIVESEGNKIATIQAVDKGGYTYVHNEQREEFPSIKLLSKKYNIVFENTMQPKTASTHDCHGYPCVGRPYNQAWDVQRKLPLYTKQPKSKSVFCAGHYIIKLNGTWVKESSPKNIMISRYEFMGPYKTKEEQTEAWNNLV
jgi:hypothetical protein